MTTSLGKRSSTNGISDIAYKDEKAPIYTSTDQFIQGVKTFNNPIRALNNVLCSGYYYGDGSHLTNVTGLDPSKLPLSGGTLTGPVTVVSMNGESTLSSDVLDVHAGEPKRSQLSAPSLNFNDDTSDKYVAIGTSTITGGVCGTLIVDGATGSNAALALAPTPTLRLEDVTSGEIMTLTSNSLSYSNANLAINSTGSTSIQAASNVLLESTANGDINLLAYNLNSYGFALPFCFEFMEIDRTFTYNAGGQNWDLVWQKDLYLPTQFFTEAPSSGYTSRNWRIDFTINTWNGGGGNNSQDKATAYYIVFEDQAGGVYTPQIITPQTPYCRHNNNSTWTAGGPYSEFQPFSWSDIVDLQGISGSYGNLLPLRFKVYFAADNPKDFRFNYKLGLTRTNLIL